jgi:hypothetical protein
MIAFLLAQIGKIKAAVNTLSGEVAQNKAWTLIDGVDENQAKTIDSKYNEVFADCAFASGNHICFHVIRPSSGETRQDAGFYYTQTANGAGVVTFNALSSVLVLHPYFGGSQSTYSSIKVYAR